jgi:ribonuclease P protein component
MKGLQGDSRDHADQAPAAAATPRGTDRPAPYARLTRRSEFVAAAKGARLHEAPFTLQAIARDSAGPSRRFGLTVTKKTGNAVVRNRIRRRLREALRQSGAARGEMADGGAADYVIVARRACLTRDFAALAQDLARAVARIDRRLAAKAGEARDRGEPAAH